VKKIIGLSIAALLVISMIAVGTFAYFSDQETSTGNTITAGTLNLVPLTVGNASATTSYSSVATTGGGDAVNGNVVWGNVGPGTTGTEEWVLYNSGSIGGVLSLNAIAPSVTGALSATALAGISSSTDPIGMAYYSVHNAGLDSLNALDYLGVTLQYASASNATLATAITDAKTAVDTGTYLAGTSTNYIAASGLQSVLAAQTSISMPAHAATYTVYVLKLSWALGVPNSTFATSSGLAVGQVVGSATSLLIGYAAGGSLYEPITNHDVILTTTQGPPYVNQQNMLQGASYGLNVTFTMTQVTT